MVNGGYVLEFFVVGRLVLVCVVLWCVVVVMVLLFC